jgi:hypothetical protein
VVGDRRLGFRRYGDGHRRVGDLLPRDSRIRGLMHPSIVVGVGLLVGRPTGPGEISVAFSAKQKSDLTGQGIQARCR